MCQFPSYVRSSYVPPPPQVNERYPKEIEKRQRRAAALQEAFTNGVNTEMDLQKLQAQVCAVALALGASQQIDHWR